MKDASFIEVRQVGHVFNFLELWWVHLAKYILLHGLVLLTYIMIRQIVLTDINLLEIQPQLFMARKYNGSRYKNISI
jgi:hypothetical protein